MPWKETCSVDQRIACVAEWLEYETPITELALRYGVSRKTVYKWLDRFEEEGAPGLADRSRAPKRHGRAMAPEIREALLAARLAHPRWGPRKLRAALARREPGIEWPAASSIGELFRRAGLSTPRRKTHTVVPLTQPLLHAREANDVWTTDFKGWFRTRNQARCDPLTINDAASRFALCCRIVTPTSAEVRPCFERTFEEYGLPHAIRSDNGPPFASTGPGRLTRLSVWWLKLGIVLDRIDPGHPEQNGRQERFHLTLQQEAGEPPAWTLEEQQARYDRVRWEYNFERPHEALDNRCPGDVYVASPRPYPRRLADPWYDATHQVRRVHQHGQIKWGGEQVFISEALIGELVGIAEADNGDWIVRFTHYELGTIDRNTSRFRAAWHGRRPRHGRRSHPVVASEEWRGARRGQGSSLRSDPASAGPEGP